MTKKNDDRFKSITITAIWIAVAVASLKLGFFTIGVAFCAFLATYAIVEA